MSSHSRAAQPERVSVVIPARDAAATIGQQLAAVAAQEYPGAWEVVVVDNGSTDATGQVASRWASALPALAVLRADERRSPGYARNVGARHAAGELLLFCDADDQVQPGWLRGLVGAAAGADAAGGRFDEQLLNGPAARGWRAPLVEERLPVGWWFLPYAPSGNLAVWADAFWAVGGFDEGLRFSEDTDLSWRLQLAGYRLGLAPDALVACRHPTSLPALLRQAFQYGGGGVDLRVKYHRLGVRGPRAAPLTQRGAALLRQGAAALRSQDDAARWLRRLAFESGAVWAHVRRGIGDAATLARRRRRWW